MPFFAAFPALAYDNSACWRYAAQQGPRPDITCTPITVALLTSLRDAPLPEVVALMNEPGVPYPDGTVHYTGDDQKPDDSLLGTIALTVAGGVVVGISGRFDSPTQGGAYLYYRWTAQSFCSDLPGGGPACGPQPPY